MSDVGDLPVVTVGNCVLKTGTIKWPLKLYGRFSNVLNVFTKSKNMTFYVFLVVAHVFSCTAESQGPASYSKDSAIHEYLLRRPMSTD